MIFLLYFAITILVRCNDCIAENYYGENCDEYVTGAQFSSTGTYIIIPWIVRLSDVPTENITAGVKFDCSFPIYDTGNPIVWTDDPDFLGDYPQCEYESEGIFTHFFRVYLGDGIRDYLLQIGETLYVQTFTDRFLNLTVEAPTNPVSPTITLNDVAVCNSGEDFFYSASSPDGRTLIYDWYLYQDEGLLMRSGHQNFYLTSDDPLEPGEMYRIKVVVTTYFGGFTIASTMCTNSGTRTDTTDEDDNDGGSSNAGLELLPFFISLSIIGCICCFACALLTTGLLFFPMILLFGRGHKSDPDTRLSLMEFIGLDNDDLKRQEEMAEEEERRKRQKLRDVFRDEEVDSGRKDEEERMLLGFVSSDEGTTEGEEKKKDEIKSSGEEDEKTKDSDNDDDDDGEGSTDEEN